VISMDWKGKPRGQRTIESPRKWVDSSSDDLFRYDNAEEVIV
jgi:hypothetical protein